MPKFFVPKENISDTEILITGEDVLHIKRVLRMREGEEIMLCDSKGYDYRTEISEIGDKEICCDILEKIKSETEPNIHVTLFQGLPKASKMDYIIQKTTELEFRKSYPAHLQDAYQNRRVTKRLPDGKKLQKRPQSNREGELYPR